MKPRTSGTGDSIQKTLFLLMSGGIYFGFHSSVIANIQNTRRNGGGFHLGEVDEPADNWECHHHHYILLLLLLLLLLHSSASTARAGAKAAAAPATTTAKDLRERRRKFSPVTLMKENKSKVS